MKTKLRILSLLIALAMCFSLLVSCGEDKGNDKDVKETDEKTEQEVKLDPKKDPNGALAAAIEMLADNYGSELLDMAEVLEKAGTGTAEYNLGLAFDGVDASVNCITDSKNGSLSGKVKFGYENISTSVDVWFDDDLVVKAPAILGDEAYGVKLSTIMEDLDKSPLLQGLGYESADDLLEDLKESFESESEISIDEFASIFETMFSAENAKDIENKFSAEIGKVLDGIDVEVTTDKDDYKLTYTITNETLEAFAKAYVNVIKDAYGDVYEMLGVDIDEMFGGMDEAFGQMEDASAPVSFYLDGKTGELKYISFTSEDKNDTYSLLNSLTISFTSDKIVLTVATDESDETYTYKDNVTLTYEKASGSGSTGFKLLFASSSEYKDLEDSDYDYGYETSGEISFTRAKDGKFELKAAADGEEMATVKGTLKYDKNSVEFALESIEADGESMPIELSFSVKSGGKVEKAPNYKNVITMNEDDWEELVEAVSSSAVIEEIGSLIDSMGSAYEDNYFDEEYYVDEYYVDEYYDDEYYDDYEF